ncbi:NAD-dependent dehydratase, partial [Streptomyces sp. SB3404]|nr:NAD-dependent dehydratase [Streptomyces boncukensis]
GVLLLSQCARRLGRPTLPLPLPAIRWSRSALRTVGATDFSAEQLRLLTHGRVVRTAHAREALGFAPRYTTAETLAAFARSRGDGLLPPWRLARAVDAAAGLLTPGPEKPEEEVRRDG